MGRKNIVLCGRAGCGKSSIANMLIQGNIYPDGENLFKISNNAKGETTEITYVVDERFGVYDLIGLGELTSGGVPHDKAVKNMRNIFSEVNERLNYICYVKQANRNTDEDARLFNTFKEIFKEGERNFVIIVTYSGPDWVNNLVDNERNVDITRKAFGNYPIISVDFPCNIGEDYAEPDQRRRVKNLQHLLDKLSKLNYEGINLEILSSSQKFENNISKIVSIVPVVGTLYELTASGVYYKLGKPKAARKRLVNGVTGIAVDAVSVVSLGVGKPVLTALKVGGRAALNAGARAVGVVVSTVIEEVKK